MAREAQELLRRQYAAVGAAARAGLGETVAALDQAATSGVDVGALLERFRVRAEDGVRFVDAYRRYCCPVRGLDDLKLAPFHLLATAGIVHVDKKHLWHMGTLAELCAADDLLHPTAYTVVDTTDRDSEQADNAWWADLTDRGGEGMVVKPARLHHPRAARRRPARAQAARSRVPAHRLRARITEPANLEPLRERGLGRKRSLASRAFAHGIEALERFVRDEPLRRVHECVFGVLALESEPVDPRV